MTALAPRYARARRAVLAVGGIVAVMLAISGSLTDLASQRRPAVPARPPLPPEADANDPEAYLAFADLSIDINPDLAVDAYFWAARLDPTSALAYYGQRTARLIANGPLLQAFMEGRGRALRSPARREVDSLYLRAAQLDPLLYPRHSQSVYVAYVKRRGRVTSEVMTRIIFAQAGPIMNARYAAAVGEVERAITLYAEALAAGADTVLVRFERGMVYATLSPLFETAGIVDSALADLRAVREALSVIRDDSATDATYYFSTALHEHRIAALLALTGDRAAAREAYGRAMVEDLSYFPAHLATATLAMETNDMLTALSAMALAVDAAPSEPVVQLRHGELLALVEEYGASAEAMRRVIALEPHFALPHYRLAEMLEITGNAADAVEEYRRFVSLSAQRDPLRAAAEERISALAPPSARPPHGSSATTRSQ